MNFPSTLLRFLLFLLPLAALNGQPVTSKSQHPDKWAQPITQQGLPNLNRVSETLYRSAQPLPDGYAELKNLGIKTVICLRSGNTDKEYGPAHDLRIIHIGMRAWHPEDEEVVEFLKAATNPENQPVLVHCKHGADRTGLMCAVYRVAVQGWTKDEAIQEMTEGGYGFHSVWQNIIRFFKKMDIEKIKREAGLP